MPLLRFYVKDKAKRYTTKTSINGYSAESENLVSTLIKQGNQDIPFCLDKCQTRKNYSVTHSLYDEIEPNFVNLKHALEFWFDLGQQLLNFCMYKMITHDICHDFWT